MPFKHIYDATLLLSSKKQYYLPSQCIDFPIIKPSYGSSTTCRYTAYHTTNWWDVQFETQVQVFVHQSSSLSIMFISTIPLIWNLQWIDSQLINSTCQQPQFLLEHPFMEIHLPPPMIPPTKSPPKAVGKTKKNKRNGRPATPPKINRWNLKMIGLGIWFSFSRGPVSSQVNQPLAFWGVPFFCAKKIFQRSRGWLEKLPFQV